MLLHPTHIDQVWTADLEPLSDNRGWFARAWCRDTLQSHGLAGTLEQCNLAFSHLSGTLRGLHYQQHPHWEDKFVRCVRGSAFVVAVDVRTESPTHRKWFGVELSAENRRALYVGKGCVQGYQTLADDTELLYQMSTRYESSSGAGYRYDDPAFAIAWPAPVTAISEKDQHWGPYSW